MLKDGEFLKQLSNYQVLITTNNILPLKSQLKITLKFVHGNENKKIKHDMPHPQLAVGEDGFR
jgi:hypothetical protein